MFVVWRDGTFNEFQNTWNEQPIIPGYVAPGTETDYDKEIDGIQVSFIVFVKRLIQSPCLIISWSVYINNK